jgi:hypothetical protein
MSSSNHANYADVVEEDFVKEQCPEAFQSLVDALAECDVNWDALGISGNFDLMEDDLTEDGLAEDLVGKIVCAFDTLVGAFKSNTGLELSIGHYEAEDRADEVDGVYWKVEGVYRYTEAGNKWKSKIERKHWTTWG